MGLLQFAIRQQHGKPLDDLEPPYHPQDHTKKEDRFHSPERSTSWNHEGHRNGETLDGEKIETPKRAPQMEVPVLLSRSAPRCEREDVQTNPTPSTLLVAAYRHRLESFRFSSLRDLQDAPYAPFGLRIIEDVLSLWRAMRDAIHEERSREKKRAYTAAGEEGDPQPMRKLWEEKHPGGTNEEVQTGKSSLSCTSIANHVDEGSALLPVLLSRSAHCQQVLSSPKDVAYCLTPVVQQAREMREVAKVMGSGEWESQKALQEITRQVSLFVDALHVVDVCYDHPPSPCTSLSLLQEEAMQEWPIALPVAVHLVLRRAVLHLSAALGLHVLAVEALQELERLHERVLRLQSEETKRKDSKRDAWKAETSHRRDAQDHACPTDVEEEVSIDHILCGALKSAKKPSREHLVPSSSVTSRLLPLAHNMPEACRSSSSTSFFPSSLVVAEDYLAGIQSCAAAKEFDLALGLFHRLLDHVEREKKKSPAVEGACGKVKSERSIETEEPKGRGTLACGVGKAYSIPSNVPSSAPSSTTTPDSSFSLLSHAHPMRDGGTSSLSCRAEVILQSLTALASASRDHEDFRVLRSLLVDSAAAEVIPFSCVEFYTAMIHAVCRAVPSAVEAARYHVLRQCHASDAAPSRFSSDGTSLSVRQDAMVATEVTAVYAHYLSIALSFYRQIRDVGLIPRPETYAGLMGCSAVCREPTQAFAFYHEARCVCKGEGGKKNPRRRSSSADDPTPNGSLGRPKDSQEQKDDALLHRGGAYSLLHEEEWVADGIKHFTPSMYTNLLLAYHYAGYDMDAKKTLDVLVEAGAPLERASFHAVLAGCVTLREGQEVLDTMVKTYRLSPTPHTFAFLIQSIIPLRHRGGHSSAEEKRQRRSSCYGGVEALLQLYDLHELALQALAEEVEAEESWKDDLLSSRREAEGSDGSSSPRPRRQGVELEKVLVQRYFPYITAVTQILLLLRLDPHADPRVASYLKPLVRVAQLGMNAYTGCTPQCPTHIPSFPPPASSASASTSVTPSLCVAVLAADVLANVEAYVMPFLSHYSLMVLPFSALFVLQQGNSAGWSSTTFPPATGPHPSRDTGKDVGEAPLSEELLQASLSDGPTRTSPLFPSPPPPSGRGPRAQQQSQLQHFLQRCRSSIHLMSLEEELCWSRDTHRYRIPRRDWLASAAAMTLNLARPDMKGGTTLYHARIPTAEASRHAGRERWSNAFSAVLHSTGRCTDVSAALPAVQHSVYGLAETHQAASSSTLPHDSPVLVLVSTQFYRCGRYLVDFKAQVQREVRDEMERNRRLRNREISSECRDGGYHTQGGREEEKSRSSSDTRGVSSFSGAVSSSLPSLALQAAVSHVFYHNPYTTPIWSPPLLSAQTVSRSALHPDAMDDRAAGKEESDPHFSHADQGGSGSSAGREGGEIYTEGTLLHTPVGTGATPLRYPTQRCGKEDAPVPSWLSSSRNMEGESVPRSGRHSTASQVSDHLRALQRQIIPQRKRRPSFTSHSPE